MSVPVEQRDNPVRWTPERILVLHGKGGITVPVLRTIIHSPYHHPPECPVGEEWYAVEFVTAYGKRWYGFTSATIDSYLRCRVTINTRDEVLRNNWEIAAPEDISPKRTAKDPTR